MSLHRETSGSLSVQDLLGAVGAGTSTSHRADSASGGYVRAVAGVAVAAGALLTTVAQLAPAAAVAAPPTPVDEADPVADPVPLDIQSAPELLQAAVDATVAAVTNQMPPAPTETAAPAEPAPAPAAAPFGLAGLPAEIATPLAQAEQTIKQLQQQFAPAPPAPAPFIAAPAVLPVGGQISSGFGSRWGAFHYGVDIADALGTPIHSALGGTVVEAGPADGFGLWVRVLQDDGTTAVYGHVNDIYVAEGQRVNAGDVIATVGNRGQSTGPHLHLEIWDQHGNKIDPVSWLAAKGVLMEQHWGAH
ncbi:M23 family metallopeptidase [Nocardia otitidiscaviarum]|uniref:M23 family metallopeptidase n=1 Tax=Nocardia otitidiscaviarum TaxID=1823 RepID=UPI00245885A7|nr:M23 family metallopeptidase [Nocardia otitidiscaviarum]